MLNRAEYFEKNPIDPEMRHFYSKLSPKLLVGKRWKSSWRFWFPKTWEFGCWKLRNLALGILETCLETLEKLLVVPILINKYWVT